MGRGDKETKVKWLLSGELEQPDSKSIVPGRHCRMALGSFTSSRLSPDTQQDSASLMGRPACGWVWPASWA